MADEQARNQNPGNEQDKGKAMGAGAGADQKGGINPVQHSERNETAGQGGGMQGTGQRQSNPGGYTSGQEGQRDEGRNEGSTQGRQEPRGGE